MLDNPQITELIKELTATRTEMASFRTELLGNGQPGRIQRIEAAVASTQDEVKALELNNAETKGKHARLAGYISAGVSTIITAVFQYFLSQYVPHTK